MEREENELTPMMRQYAQIKKEHQDKVLFFRLGDFYEMFSSDAREVSRLLNLTLTHRGSELMCGIPYHAAKGYIKRLLEAGKKVAICEQTEMSGDSRKLCERKVVAIYTPATVVEDDFLSSLDSSYILSVFQDKSGLYIAYSDITSGDFKLSVLPLEKNYKLLDDKLMMIMPKEILIEDDLYYSSKALKMLLDSTEAMVTPLPSFYFEKRSAYKELEAQFSSHILSSRSIEEASPQSRVAGALLRYMREMRKESLPQLDIIEWENGNEHLFLSSASIKSLELVKNQSDGGSQMTLFSAVNRTRTSSGARLLKKEILNPLANVGEILVREDWVERFYENNEERESVRKALSGISDVERIATRMEMEKTQPRDLVAFSDSLSSLMSILDGKEDLLKLSDDEVDFGSLVEFSIEIEKGINRECTNIQSEGTIILKGYDEEYDKILSFANDNSFMLTSYMEKLKEEYGITSMKLSENRIIGHFLEVSKRESDKIPPFFIRRQTLVSSERYTTEELSNMENEIVRAKESAFSYEKKLYKNFVGKAKDLSLEIRKMGGMISRLDFFSSLAELSRQMSYVRPVLSEDGSVEIRNGRHPVVESYMNRSDYVPNSFSTGKGRFSLVTGPNMAGKSTYLREVALIAILFQIGSFVPAESARLPVFDKLFSRVGASDNLARGESTFLVEMSESAEILRSATSRSLIIMDEIGRGTSTEDGMAIAYAIMQYLKKLGAVTLFSTHYRELSGLDPDGVSLLTMEVEEEKSGIRFLRKAVEGVAKSSYGIHVAKIAGLPRSVIKDAKDFQKRHFDLFESISSGQQSLFQGDDEESVYEEAGKEIASFDIDNSTPMEAFLFIRELKKMLEGKQ